MLGLSTQLNSQLTVLLNHADLYKLPLLYLLRGHIIGRLFSRFANHFGGSL